MIPEYPMKAKTNLDFDSQVSYEAKNESRFPSPGT